MRGVIYKYVNKSNGKVYIGQTVNETKRKNEHKRRSKKQKQIQSAFYNAIDKYGWDNFEYSVLETINAETLEELKAKLNPLEIKYIQEYDSYNNGYNNTLGGDHAGYRPRAILEYDMQGNLLRKYNSYLDIPSESKYGPTRVYYACNHSNATCHGHIWRWEDNDLTKMPYEEGTKSKYIYYQWTMDNILVKVWPSVVLAQKAGYDASGIIKCCKGKWKNHKGFVWTRELKTDKDN